MLCWETWKTTQETNKKITNFCLRQKLRIWWPETISNTTIWEFTNQISIDKNKEINRNGHALRKESENITKQAMEWNPL